MAHSPQPENTPVLTQRIIRAPTRTALLQKLPCQLSAPGDPQQEMEVLCCGLPLESLTYEDGSEVKLGILSQMMVINYY